MLKKILLSILIILFFTPTVFAENQSQPLTIDPNKVQLFFFWGDGCPHCAAAKPFLADLEKKYDQLQIITFEIYNTPENQKIAQDFAQIQQFQFEGVPVFIIGQEHLVGFDNAENSGKQIEDLVINCLNTKCQAPEKIQEYVKNNQITTATTITNAGNVQGESTTSNNTNNSKTAFYLIPAAIVILFIIIYFIARKSKV